MSWIYLIFSQYLSLSFNGQTGFLQGLTNLEKSLTIKLSNRLHYYKSFVGNNNGDNDQASGAYIFRPNGTYALPVSHSATTSLVQVILALSLYLVSYVGTFKAAHNSDIFSNLNGSTVVKKKKFIHDQAKLRYLEKSEFVLFTHAKLHTQ